MVVVVVVAIVVVFVAVAAAAADCLQRRVQYPDSQRFQPFFARIFASSKNTNYGISTYDNCRRRRCCCVASRPATR